jgi:hypothetical protein
MNGLNVRIVFCLLILTTLQDEKMITNRREKSCRRRVES